MAPPPVSILIPAYNAAQYLPETLASVRAQSWGEYEVIVVNDGSTDATAEVLAAAAREDTRLRALTIPNGGVSAARQAGVAQARGEWIAFLDADDLWLPGKLEKQMRLIQERPQVDLVYTDMVNFFPTREERTSLFEQKQPARGNVLERLFYGNFILTSTVVVRKSALDAVGGFNPAIQVNEDVDLFLRLAEHYTFDYVDEVLVRRRMCETSLIHSYPEKIHRQDLALIDEWCGRRPDLFDPASPAVCRRQALIRARLGEACWHNGHYADARRFLRAALSQGQYNRRRLALFLLSCLPPLDRLIKARRTRRAAEFA